MFLVQSVNVIRVYRKEFQGTFHSTQNCRKFRLVHQMERTISVLSYRNIRDQLWRSSTLTGLARHFGPKYPFLFDKLLSPVPLFCILVTRIITKRAVAWVWAWVCATWMYRSIWHLKFPKFQSVEWKAPPNSTVRPTGWVIGLHPLTLFSQQNQYIIQVNSLENWQNDRQNEKALVFPSSQLTLQETVWRSVERICMWIFWLNSAKWWPGYDVPLIYIYIYIYFFFWLTFFIG